MIEKIATYLGLLAIITLLVKCLILLKEVVSMRNIGTEVKLNNFLNQEESQ